MFNICASFILYMLLGANDKCICNKPTDIETVVGANEIIEYKPQKVRRLKGTITDEEGNPFETGIVELYKFEKGSDSYTFADNHYRLTACKTDPKGRFCFNNLMSGKYILKAGIPEGGFNAVYIVITVSKLKLFRGSKNIHIKLRIGN